MKKEYPGSPTTVVGAPSSWKSKVRDKPGLVYSRVGSENPKYVTQGGLEYLIEQDPAGFFFIKPYGGGRVRKELQGRFTSYAAAEKPLIQFLERTDKINRAIYPGKTT